MSNILSTQCLLLGYFKGLCFTQKSELLIKNHSLDLVKIFETIFDKRKNIFITGPAGSGKTYTLNKLYSLAKRLNYRVVM